MKITITGVDFWLIKNKSVDEIQNEYVCPFINNETTILFGEIFNLSSIGSLKVYVTDKPIDSNWPIKVDEFVLSHQKDQNVKTKEGHPSTINELKPSLDELESSLLKMEFEDELKEYLENNTKNVTEELYKQALILVESGKYKDIRKTYLESLLENRVFFICPFGFPEVDHNYEFVIKPLVEKYQFKIQRADELVHTGTINEAILDAINKSKFVIADLTGERPNCYYELGYAHSKSIPAIILAKSGSERHFDISTYKWNYWNDYQDLKFTLEKEIGLLLKQVVF